MRLHVESSIHKIQISTTYIIHRLFIHVTPRSTEDSLKRARAACC